jgi:hypothetical protein
LENATEYKKQKSIAQKTAKQEAQQYWQNFCSPTSKLAPVWCMAKRMNGNLELPSVQSIHDDTAIYTSNEDKANALSPCTSWK